MRIVPFISSSLERRPQQQAARHRKVSTSLQLAAVSILGFGMAANGFCQTYYLLMPLMSGYGGDNAPQLLFQDANYTTNIVFTWDTLTETIYLDPEAQTIRQVGFASVTPSVSTIVFNETQQITNAFPNPPTIIPATVTVSLGFPGGGYSFDTGPRPITWNPTAQAYTFDGKPDSQLYTVTGTYSLVTGGQTLTGVCSYTFPSLGGPLNAFTKVYIDDYPTSLSLDGFGGWFETLGYWNSGTGPAFATASATNGVQMQLVPHTFCHVSWAAINPPVSATNIATGPPSITSQPQGVLVAANSNATFHATSFGAMPLGYQWSLNNTNIAGATSSTLAVANVGQSDLGTYVVIVTNQFGLVTSSNAVLSMYPFIEVPFTGAVTYWGKAATFGIQAWGTGPLSYQWFKDGVAILNSNTQSLTFASIQSTNAGLYSAVVSSSLGTVTNAPAQVIVYPAGVSLGFCPTVTISGVVGYSYIIQSSTNLTDTNAWATLTNLTLTQPVQLWVDTNVDASSPFNSKYFYRVLPGQ